MLISTENLSKSFGDRQVLKNINMTVEEKCRYGLIGVNGAGKSTLLDIITGAAEEYEGEVYINKSATIGFLRQNSGLDRSNSIEEEMRGVFSDVFEAEREMRELERKMEGLPPEELRAVNAEYMKKQAYFDSRDGYGAEVKIKTVLNGMGFGGCDMSMSVAKLSGGEKTRLAIAKLLLEEPDLLILDEPTNHLDFKMLGWLEDYLSSYSGALLVVSHDRYFLNKVADNIFEIERGKLESYKGNYSAYLVQKAERLERRRKEYEIQQMQIAQMKTYIDKNIARASTSASAKSRIKALENMELVEKPEGDIKTMHISFSYKGAPYKDVLKTEGLCVGVGGRTLCENINLDIKRGDKIAIIGENGIGKSSLLKTLLGIIPPHGGEYKWGKNTKISFYEQENANLDYGKTAFDELRDKFPNVLDTELRRALGSVLLSGENVFKTIDKISGGERAKLALCEIMLEHANVILLDEPTNHLDLPSREELERALCEFDGTLIFVSHDRYFLNSIPSSIIEIKSDGVSIYDGNYEYYKERSELLSRASEAVEKSERAQKPEKGEAVYHRTKEQRRAEAMRKERLRELERLIEELEEETRVLESDILREEVYSDYVLMNEKCTAIEDNKNKLEEYYSELIELEE